MDGLLELKKELQRHVGAEGEAAGKDCQLSDDVAEAAVGTLQDLKACHVTTDLLMQTQLGKLVKKISKQCAHFLVKRAALDTLDVWKAVVSAEASSSAAPSSAPSSAPDAALRPSGGSEEGAGRKEKTREREGEKEGEKGRVGEGAREKRKGSELDGGPNPDSLKKDRSDGNNASDAAKGRGSTKEGGRDRGSGGGGHENGSGSQGATDRGAAQAVVQGEAVEIKMELVVGEVRLCGDPTRDRLRSLVCDALCLAAGELEAWEMEQARQLDVAELAVKVENELWNRFGSTKDLKEYKAKWRSLHFNLKNPQNPDLRRRVVMDLVKPGALVGMTPEEMASDSQKEERDRVKKQKMMETVRGDNNLASTDQFKCGKCGQRKTTYYQMQTRSADEPMTTFVSCLNCNNRWKFC